MDWLQQQYHLLTLHLPLGKHAAGTQHIQKQTSRLLHLCSAVATSVVSVFQPCNGSYDQHYCSAQAPFQVRHNIFGRIT